MRIDLKDIKPRLANRSDKYSSNLYRFLRNRFKENKYVQNQIEIHWLTHSRWDGSYLEFNPDNVSKGLGQLLILPLGKENGRSFYSLHEVLRKGKTTEFAIPWMKDELVDITDWFFETYIKDGRCIFDRDHNKWLSGDESRFTKVNNTRKCNWCGEWQEKQIVKVQKIDRKEIWVSQ
ncbi:hypothetical protein [Halobacillus litoralis]|uniref:hypothetical protein n=1 Tax=Halobacillus litoralis TaxID=45668 RepID=UPI001CD2F291|nr:hypothetical protein [Halobacillus litoralis]MCA1021474.1 hypothetical protein [Halobacillus litoralis]